MAAYTVLALQVLQTLLPPAWHYQHTPIRGKKAGFPTLQNPTHAGCSKWYYLPSSRLCFGRSNPLFKHIQIDL
eukprot:jgi/Chrzof1/3813/Cz13g09220.t1